MKKLIVLLIMTLVKLTAFSQIDTAGNNSVKCLPVPIVKMIIKELIEGDSAKAELILTEQQLLLTEQKIDLKDSVIFYMKEKEQNYLNNINLSEKKYTSLLTYTEGLEKNFNKVSLQLKVSKTKNKIKNFIISGGVVIAIGYTAVWYFLLK